MEPTKKRVLTLPTNGGTGSMEAMVIVDDGSYLIIDSNIGVDNLPILSETELLKLLRHVLTNDSMPSNDPRLVFVEEVRDGKFVPGSWPPRPVIQWKLEFSQGETTVEIDTNKRTLQFGQEAGHGRRMNIRMDSFLGLVGHYFNMIKLKADDQVQEICNQIRQSRIQIELGQ